MVGRCEDADAKSGIGLLFDPRFQVLHFQSRVSAFELFNSIGRNIQPDEDLCCLVTEMHIGFLYSPLLSPRANDPLRFSSVKHSGRGDDTLAIGSQLCSPGTSVAGAAAQHDDDVKRFARDAVDLFPR